MKQYMPVSEVCSSISDTYREKKEYGDAYQHLGCFRG